MQTEKNKIMGLVLMFLGIAGFFFFFWYFQLNGAKLDEKNIPLLLKMIFTTFFPLLCLYFGLYFSHTKKLANQIVGSLVVFLIVAFILGSLLH